MRPAGVIVRARTMGAPVEAVPNTLEGPPGGSGITDDDFADAVPVWPAREASARAAGSGVDEAASSAGREDAPGHSASRAQTFSSDLRYNEEGLGLSNWEDEPWQKASTTSSRLSARAASRGNEPQVPRSSELPRACGIFAWQRS